MEIKIVFIVVCWVVIGVEDKELRTEARVSLTIEVAALTWVFIDVDGVIWVVANNSWLVMEVRVTGDPDICWLGDIEFTVFVVYVVVELISTLIGFVFEMEDFDGELVDEKVPE